MTDVPPIWSQNWVHNMEQLSSWCKAIIVISNISTHDYEMYSQRCAFSVQNEELQDVLSNYGSDLGGLLDWVERGIKCHNEHTRVPEACLLSDLRISSTTKTNWKTHILNHVCDLKSLIKTMKTVRADIILRLSEYDNQFDQDYDWIKSGICIDCAQKVIIKTNGSIIS